MKLARRKFLTQTSLLIVTTLLPWSFAIAQAQRIRVGLMLPYSGTYAQLGTAITNGFKLAVTERSGKLGGRELEFFTVDDEAEPSKAPENTNKLVQRDKVDVLVGTVHSGVHHDHTPFIHRGQRSSTPTLRLPRINGSSLLSASPAAARGISLSGTRPTGCDGRSATGAGAC